MFLGLKPGSVLKRVLSLWKITVLIVIFYHRVLSHDVYFSEPGLFGWFRFQFQERKEMRRFSVAPYETKVLWQRTYSARSIQEISSKTYNMLCRIRHNWLKIDTKQQKTRDMEDLSKSQNWLTEHVWKRTPFESTQILYKIHQLNLMRHTIPRYGKQYLQ